MNIGNHKIHFWEIMRYSLIIKKKGSYFSINIYWSDTESILCWGMYIYTYIYVN